MELDRILKDANSIMFNLLGNRGELSGNKYKKLIGKYKSSPELREILESTASDYMCEVKCIDNRLFLIPLEENPYLGFKLSDSKLKGVFKKDEYYLGNIIIAVIFSELLNERKELDYLEVSDLLTLVDESLNRAEKKQKDGNEDAEDLNIDKLKSIWDSKLPYPEGDTKKSRFSTISLNYRMGYINKVVKFLEQESLINRVEDSISAKPRLKLLMENRILNVNRRYEVEKLLIG